MPDKKYHPTTLNDFLSFPSRRHESSPALPYPRYSPFPTGTSDPEWESGSPRGVRLYSTLGGTTGYTTRFTMPSSSSSRSCVVSMRCVMSGVSDLSSQNRSVPSFPMCHMMIIFHLPPIMESVSYRISAHACSASYIVRYF